MNDKQQQLRVLCKELASSNIVVDALARFLEQVITEVHKNMKEKKQ